MDAKYPPVCHNGHELGPGRISKSFTPCDCPASVSGQPPGHHNVYCGVIGCRSEYWPEGCDGRSASPTSIGRPVAD